VRLRNFRRLFSEVVSSAGLPAWVTPYTLRHTCPSLLARQGVHPAVAADVLGHDPAVYLRTYAHLYPEDRGPRRGRVGRRPADRSVPRQPSRAVRDRSRPLVAPG